MSKETICLVDSGRTVHRPQQTNDSFRPNVMNRTDVVKTRAHIRGRMCSH